MDFALRLACTNISAAATDTSQSETISVSVTGGSYVTRKLILNARKLRQ
jgi:hypothetical protein